MLSQDPDLQKHFIKCDIFGVHADGRACVEHLASEFLAAEPISSEVSVQTSDQKQSILTILVAHPWVPMSGLQKSNTKDFSSFPNCMVRIMAGLIQAGI